MRKENEFGNVYHQMNFSRDELEVIRYSLTTTRTYPKQNGKTMLLNIIDRIEKELGIE